MLDERSGLIKAIFRLGKYQKLDLWTAFWEPEEWQKLSRNRRQAKEEPMLDAAEDWRHQQGNLLLLQSLDGSLQLYAETFQG